MDWERGSIFWSLLWPSLGIVLVVALLGLAVALALRSHDGRHL